MAKPEDLYTLSDDIFELFTKQVDELKQLDFDDLDFMNRKYKIGNFGGKTLTTKQIRALKKMLKEKYNVDLIYEGANNLKRTFKPFVLDVPPTITIKKPKDLFNHMQYSKINISPF